MNKNAVAIAYQTGDNSPRVVAKGKGLIADEIIKRAKEHGVHVHESTELVSLLMKVDLDANIPPNLYRAVAELLAWLYHMDNIHLDHDSREPAENTIGIPKKSDSK